MINYSLIGVSENVHEINMNNGWQAIWNIYKAY